jgi:outer membrane protein assembly factor BamE (lipoprotein component of BamABCDE complex)
VRRARSSRLALAALALTACTITRDYIGSPLRADPAVEIHPGSTDMADVLRTFGAPDRILRHAAGDVFVYRYRRSNTEVLAIEEPVITNTEIFTYSRTREKEDRLVVLFDREGRVRSFGYLHGTAELDGEPDS